MKHKERGSASGMAEEDSRRRLGRGLAALIGEMDQPVKAAEETVTKETGTSNEMISADRRVPIEHLRANPNNPRRFFAEHELIDLANSIREHGIVQPILVRPIRGEDLAGAVYEIIAGERRWRAAQKSGLHDVPVVIRDVEDRQALELAIIENVQRSDLNAVEEALGYQQLINEYDYSQGELGDVIGKSRSHVANTLRLLKLPAEVQGLVSDGSLSAGHARTLVTADNPAEIAQLIVRDGLSVRQAEAMAQNTTEPSGNVAGTKTNAGVSKDADTKALERELEDALGLKVDLNWKPDGKGDIRIKFKSLEQLDSVCERLRNRNI